VNVFKESSKKLSTSCNNTIKSDRQLVKNGRIHDYLTQGGGYEKFKRFYPIKWYRAIFFHLKGKINELWFIFVADSTALFKRLLFGRYLVSRRVIKGNLLLDKNLTQTGDFNIFNDLFTLLKCDC
jgi:hypothetical protein